MIVFILAAFFPGAFLKYYLLWFQNNLKCPGVTMGFNPNGFSWKLARVEAVADGISRADW
jgi:hypothetical protein